MAKHIPANIATFASTRETSPEIALAIFEIASEGDEDRMWNEPTPEEFKLICLTAWRNTNETVLHWGNTTIDINSEYL
jgi:hypothetical protein